MCGRFAFFSPREAIEQAFGAGMPPLFEPRYNIAPTQSVLTLVADETGKPTWRSLRWGLVPFWAKDASIGNRMINARAETVGEKPAYRTAFKRRRCVVIGTGFYEWQKGERYKIPWFIGRADEQPLAMAGIWEVWEKGEGEPLRTCSIITSPANAFMADIHHRMPVIMERAELPAWFAPDTERDSLEAMLLGPRQTELRAWTVSRKVNSPANDTPDLVEPVEYDS